MYLHPTNVVYNKFVSVDRGRSLSIEMCYRLS